MTTMNCSMMTQRRILPAVGCLTAALLCSLVAAAPAGAANFDLVPSLTVSEEWNDNIFETAANRRTDFITRAQPGFTSRYQAPVWRWDMGYAFDYHHYARGSRGDEYTHNADLRGTVTLLDNLLFLDVSDTYHRVTLDVARTVVTESSLFLNQTDQNNAAVSPYLQWRLGQKNSLRTGYRFTDIRYWGDGVERQEHGAFADFSHEVTAKFSLSAGYAYTRLESEPTRFDKHDVSGGFRYEYADRSFVFGQVGNSWQQFLGGTGVNYLFWNAGLTHDLGGAVAVLETRLQTAVDPLAVTTRETSYSGRIEKTLDRGLLSFAAAYLEFSDSQNNGSIRKRLSFTAAGRYEVFPDITANLAVTTERFSRRAADDYPYHLVAGGGVSWAFKDNLTLGVTYYYATQRREIDRSTAAIDTSRAMLEVRKAF